MKVDYLIETEADVEIFRSTKGYTYIEENGTVKPLEDSILLVSENSKLYLDFTDKNHGFSITGSGNVSLNNFEGNGLLCDITRYGSGKVSIENAIFKDLTVSGDLSDVSVKNAIAGNFNGKNHQGDISIDGLVGMTVKLDNLNGDIHFDMLAASAYLQVVNKNGDVETGKVNAKRADFQSSSGDISVQEINSDLINIDNENGDVSLTINDCKDCFHENVKVDNGDFSSSGVRGDYEDSSKKSLNIHCVNGDVVINYLGRTINPEAKEEEVIPEYLFEEDMSTDSVISSNHQKK